MTRFFFDYRTSDQALYDYGGQEFRSIRSAEEFAQMIVQDLSCSLTTDWNGWSVEVRNAEGRRLLSLPVEHSLQAA
jgi:Domain of unknown function (DUF6894)